MIEVNVPALCKKCCGNKHAKDGDDFLSDPGINRAKTVPDLHGTDGRSTTFDCETKEEEHLPPEHSGTLTTRHSEVFAKKDGRTGRLSYLSDARYCINDTQTAGGDANGVELSQLPFIKTL